MRARASGTDGAIAWIYGYSGADVTVAADDAGGHRQPTPATVFRLPASHLWRRCRELDPQRAGTNRDAAVAHPWREHAGERGVVDFELVYAHRLAPRVASMTMPNRCVAHLDMDAFYVSVELRRRPELVGQAVIVAGTGPRSVVTTASYEARRFGVGSAVPAARARRMCPHGVFLAPDFAYYREASREVMAIVRAHVEQVEVVGLDEAYLELTGLPAPRAAMRRVASEIAGHTGLHASIGIGPSKLVAKVASDAEKPRGFVVLTREQACARFANAPCGLIPGIGPKTTERLRELGIETLGQLAAAPAQPLVARFGVNGAAALRRRARFEDDAPVSEQRKVVSESREVTFDHDLSDPAQLEQVLDGLVQRLCVALGDQQRRGRTVGIKVRLDDFSTHTRARTLSEPVSGADRVGPVALDLLRRFDPPRPVRLLGVRVAGLAPVLAAAEEQLRLQTGP